MAYGWAHFSLCFALQVCVSSVDPAAFIPAVEAGAQMVRAAAS